MRPCHLRKIFSVSGAGVACRCSPVPNGEECRFYSPQLPSLKTPQTLPLLGGLRIQSQRPPQALLSRGEVPVRSQYAVQSNHTQRPGGAVCTEAPPCRATPHVRCLQPAGRRAARLQRPPAAHPRRHAPNIGRKLIDIRLSLNASGRVNYLMSDAIVCWGAWMLYHNNLKVLILCLLGSLDASSLVIMCRYIVATYLLAYKM
ncbi:hypothetical protein C8J57DRAFT_113107 [Mycena rebaudengoi]|nr:hypothetical protein C8J57DRAFT_113107 [Mycena rebaudengoi]